MSQRIHHGVREKQSRGHMRISSEVGQGTAVKLFLPRAVQDAVDLDIGTVETPRGPILVVEDDAIVRSIISDALKDLGYNILLAPDARPAIAFLKSDQPIDLLLSDVVLPHINGRELAERARGLRPNLKVLFVSGYAERATVRADFLDAGMDMLSKPFSLDALGAKVHAMIQL
jgi:CheY-like chemotaxis protein